MQRIASGEWSAGSALPNELDLSREYGLSSGTVRKALDWMENAGVILRQQGRGTFVRDQVSKGQARYERLRMADGSIPEAATETVVVGLEDANPNEMARLRLGPGERVRRVERLRRFGEGQVQVEFSSMPHGLFPVMASEDMPLVQLAQRSGVILGGGWERLSVQPPPTHILEKLGIGPEQSVMMLDRMIETIDGVPAEWRVSYCCIGSGYYEASLASFEA